MREGGQLWPRLLPAFLGREPLRQLADLCGNPLEPLAVGDQQGADEENGEAELSHNASIAQG